MCTVKKKCINASRYTIIVMHELALKAILELLLSIYRFPGVMKSRSCSTKCRFLLHYLCSRVHPLETPIVKLGCLHFLGCPARGERGIGNLDERKERQEKKRNRPWERKEVNMLKLVVYTAFAPVLLETCYKNYHWQSRNIHFLCIHGYPSISF